MSSETPQSPESKPVIAPLSYACPTIALTPDDEAGHLSTKSMKAGLYSAACAVCAFVLVGAPIISLPIAVVGVLFGLGAIVEGVLSIRTAHDNPTRWKVIIGLILGPICIFVCVAVLFEPPSGRARPKAQMTKCAAGLRGISQALSLYAADHQGAYPPSLAHVLQYDLEPYCLVCPNSDDDAASAGATTQQTISNVLLNPRHMTYVLVMAGKLGSSLSPRAVVVFEPMGNHPRDMAGAKVGGQNLVDGAHVLFADGHVAFLPAPAVKQMIVELNAGLNPPPATNGY